MLDRIFIYGEEHPLNGLAKEWLNKNLGFRNTKFGELKQLNRPFLLMINYDVVLDEQSVKLFERILQLKFVKLLIILANENSILLPKGLKDRSPIIRISEGLNVNESVKFDKREYRIDSRGILHATVGTVIATKGNKPVVIMYKPMEASAPIVISSLTLEFPSGGTSVVDLINFINSLVLKFDANQKEENINEVESKLNDKPITIGQVFTKWKGEVLESIIQMSLGSVNPSNFKNKDLLDAFKKLGLIDIKDCKITLNRNAFEAQVLNNPGIAPFLRRYMMK